MKTIKHMTAKQKAAIRRKEALKHLERTPMTSSDLAKWMNVSTSTSLKDLKVLHEMNQVHIVKYIGLNDVQSSPMFAFGYGEDAEMPEKKRLMLDRRAETVSEGYRERPVIVAFRHWLDVAFFGEYRRAA